MTCIVGLVVDDRVYIGGDSAAIDSTYGMAVRKDEKVFVRGSYTMGFSTSFRMGQLLKYAGELQEPPVNEDDLHGFMCTVFVDAVRKIFKDGGFCGAHSRVDEEIGGEFLVAVRARLFAVYDDFQVAESSDCYMAVGCGAPPALGALYASFGLEPLVRLRLAPEAAEKFNAGVRRPFLIKESSPYNDGLVGNINVLRSLHLKTDESECPLK